MTLSGTGSFDDSNHYLDRTENIYGFDVYDEHNEKIGKVVKAETVESELPPHLVIDIGSWLTSRQVLLPLCTYRVNPKARRIDVDGLSREEVNRLPTYLIPAQIEDSYGALETSASLDSEVALEAPAVRERYIPVVPVETPQLPQEPPTLTATPNEMVTPSESSPKIVGEEIIPLLAERVIVDRYKRKSGEVVVRKVIETEIIEVVVRREKLIVEQVSPEYKELAVIDLGRTSVEETPPS